MGEDAGPPRCHTHPSPYWLTDTILPFSLTEPNEPQCYFLDPIKRDVSQPFSTGMPKAKVCERLKKKSAEICAIKYRECRAAPFIVAPSTHRLIK